MKQILLLLALSINIFISAQTFDWAKQFGGINTTTVQHTVVDADGNTYLTGYFAGSSYLGDDPNENVVTTPEFMGTHLVKLTKTGEVAWMKTIIGNDFNSGYYIKIAADNSMYLVGNFSGSLTVDTIDGSEVFATEAEDVFIIKFNENGDFHWVKTIKAQQSYFDVGGIDQDSAGNFYMTGIFAGIADFDLGDGESTLTNEGYSDTFIVKYNPNWELIWAKKIVNTGASSIKVNDNEIIISGHFSGICDFDPSENEYLVTSTTLNDAYVLYLNHDGEFLEVNPTQGFGFSTIAHTNTGFDSDKNLYVVGTYFGEYDFSPNTNHEGEFHFNSNNLFNTYVLKYNTNRELVWIKNLVSQNEGNIQGYDLSIDNSDNIYITGYYQNQVNFDDIQINQQTDQYMEAFVARINPQGTFDYAKGFSGESDVLQNYANTDDAGNVYLTGSFEETVNLNPDENNFTVTARGNKDVYIVKLTVESMNVFDQNSSVKSVVYPNPSQNNIHIIPKSNSKQVYEIFDVTGKIVKSGNFVSNEPISISQLAKGVYILRINNIETFKIIKK